MQGKGHGGLEFLLGVLIHFLSLKTGFMGMWSHVFRSSKHGLR